MDDFRITHLDFTDIQSVKLFTDRWIGANYFSLLDLQDILEKSKKDGLNASFLAWKQERLIGVRLTFAPSTWVSSAQQICPDLWTVPPESVGYFKSLFIDEEFQNQGLGKRLSKISGETLLKQGAKAIVTHSWLESPNNSSQNYLIKSGFIVVANHKNFWEHIDYQCLRCSPSRCKCTAVEMIKYL